MMLASLTLLALGMRLSVHVTPSCTPAHRFREPQVRVRTHQPSSQQALKTLHSQVYELATSLHRCTTVLIVTGML